MTSPILYIGVDVGISRDTSATAIIYRHGDALVLAGHSIIKPRPDKRVNISREVTDPLIDIFRHQRVAGLWFDPYQFIGETQRIADMGFARYLHEVNQQSENPAFASALETAVNGTGVILYPDVDVRAHLLWTTAKATERGRRIVKQKQTKPIDFTIALAMAVYGAMQETGIFQHRGFSTQKHARGLEAIP